MTESGRYGKRGRELKPNITDLNLWWMEYSKHKLGKFWQAEGTQRANVMGHQENLYLTRIYEIQVYRKAEEEVAKKLRFSQHRARELYAVRARGQQAGGGNEIIFREEQTSIFQVARALRGRTRWMITYLHMSDGTTLTTHLVI